jgi:asparagine synthetase B (glutamine-hydrolysing)
MISNDLRLLYHQEDEFNSAGIISCLLLGTPVPPLTPFKDIHAFKPGFRYEIKAYTLVINSYLQCQWSKPSVDDYRFNIDQQAEILSNAIDSKLTQLCPTKDPVILFSGGVDSTVLALRAATMGWKQTSLIHFSFGNKDPKTKIAVEIASSLKIPLDLITWQSGTNYECLNNAASIYSQIFCDIATVPAYQLCQDVMNRFGNQRIIFYGRLSLQIPGCRRLVMYQNH